MIYYLTVVDLPELMERFEVLGLPRDSPITKIADFNQTRAVLVKTTKAQYVLSREMAANLVLQRDGVVVSLGLLEAGQSGKFLGSLYGRNDPFYQRGEILTQGMRVEKIRDLPSLRFVFQVHEGRMQTVSLDEAIHVWGSSRGRRGQLAAVFLGGKFTIESFSSPGVKDRFLASGMEPGVKLHLRGMEPNDSRASYMEIKGPSHDILLSRTHTDHIFVRACNVCWSCGACMVNGD